MTPRQQNTWDKIKQHAALVLVTVIVSSIVGGAVSLTKEPFKEINTLKDEIKIRPTYRDCNEIYVRKDVLQQYIEAQKDLTEQLIENQNEIRSDIKELIKRK
jgi:hypothetical protein